MILFISDIHFGRGGRQNDQVVEDDLVAFLRSQESSVEALYLLGDVFDYYIEYRHAVPKGLVRLQALLAEWTRAGIPVTYLVGNHDPWHQDYFQHELGVTVHYDPIIETLGAHQVYLAHGDGFGPSNGVYRCLKPLLRNSFLVSLYRTLLPGGTGMRLARWYCQRFAREEINHDLVEGLRAHAQHILQTTRADTVLMGHSHHPEHFRWSQGQYLNTGSWYFKRTFATLDAEGLLLKQWNGNKPLLVNDFQPARQKTEP